MESQEIIERTCPICKKRIDVNVSEPLCETIKCPNCHTKLRVKRDFIIGVNNYPSSESKCVYNYVLQPIDE